MKPASPSPWLLRLVTNPMAPTRPRPHPNPPQSKRKRAYGRAVLEREVRRLASAPRHQRNNTLNLGGFRLGQLIGAGILDEAEVVARLHQTATEIGLEPSEIGQTILSGIEAGRDQRRSI
jgi:putative DNA primase/helicase